MAYRKKRAREFTPERSISHKTTKRNYEVYTTLTVPIPRSVPQEVRRVDYTYPSQRQLLSKTIRVTMRRTPEIFDERRILFKLPRYLPAVLGSYVSINRDRLNIHSHRQTKRLLQREYNRRRYKERKTRQRKGRHGQLDSLRSDRFGMVAEAHRRGYSMERIADTAMVSRGLERMLTNDW